MIDLYYWPTSNGRKITIMLHEVELPYSIIPVNFKTGEQYAPEFLRINPNNKIPAIVDHDPIGGGAPITVFESVAILMYLAEKSGRLMPADPHGRYEVIKWAVFQAASIGPMFGQMAYFHDYAEPRMPAALDRYENEVRRLYKVLDRRLSEAACLAGDYSIADIAVWPWIQPARQEQCFEDYPNLKRWYETIAARPAVKVGNAIRLDLQKVGVQALSDEERRSLYARRF
ncbi:MAG: glutathione S-transferase N-terminal domain-containing protein [Alphaproteobacteria bacterium]|nr:glutathione S-transferase N-terminal domain-containing protein [Alphaproteobacteria bacterium]